MNLEDYGWDSNWSQSFKYYALQNLLPARVTAVHAAKFDIMTAEGKKSAEITGKLRYNILYSAKMPAVGDWVVVIQNPGGIHQG